MRNPYERANKAEKDKVKFNKLDEMTEGQKQEALAGICLAARAYIHQVTEKFLKNFRKRDRFQMAAKQGIINTFPQPYNEAFLNRVDRLCKMAESQGYDVKFSKWRTSAEYGWFFVREK